MSDAYYKIWERMIDFRMTDIYKSIRAPEFLVDEENRITFIEDITLYLREQVRKYKQNDVGKQLCIGAIYGLIIPLEKHFNGQEEQTFIKRISDKESMNQAIERIKSKNWQYYQMVTVKTTQSTPNAAARNYSGCSVGKGLKIAGTLQYVCLTCNKFVGFTEEEYWKHQNTIHDNPRVRTITFKKIMNKFRF